MKVKVDKKKCIGCGSCEAVCPEVFGMKDGKAYAKVSETDKKCAKEADDVCPVDAITIS